MDTQRLSFPSIAVRNVWGGRGRRRCPHPFVGGVAQVFHDLLVELQLLLVAEVEEGEKEDRQEEGLEVESGVDLCKHLHVQQFFLAVRSQCGEVYGCGIDTQRLSFPSTTVAVRNGVVFTQCECTVPTESKNVCTRNKAETWTAETEQDSKVLT